MSPRPREPREGLAGDGLVARRTEAARYLAQRPVVAPRARPCGGRDERDDGPRPLQAQADLVHAVLDAAALVARDQRRRRELGTDDATASLPHPLTELEA